MLHVLAGFYVPNDHENPHHSIFILLPFPFLQRYNSLKSMESLSNKVPGEEYKPCLIRFVSLPFLEWGILYKRNEFQVENRKKSNSRNNLNKKG